MNNEIGYCKCGCGEKTNISKINRKDRGWIKGKHINFIKNHAIKINISDNYKIDKITNCWNWLGYIAKNGYAKIGSKFHTTLAHKYLYEIKYGKVAKNKELDHLCRNRKCVNPDHLEEVSRLENSRRGSKTKINFKIAQEIRKLKNIVYYKDICKKFKIGRTLVYSIWNNQTWTK